MAESHPEGTSAGISLVGVEKEYLASETGVFIRTWRRGTSVLRGITLEIPALQFVTVVGPSGCGKTTLLNLIAGLDQPSKGEVRVAGGRVTGPRKGTGVVFQEGALLPWRTVLDNVVFALELKNHRRARAAQRQEAREALELVGLSGAAERYPWQLSGGMKQRVGIARALVCQPDVMLMDEPFGALDAQTRLVLQRELLRICTEYRATVFFITHDVDEAVMLSDRILVMNDGRVVSDITSELGTKNRNGQDVSGGAEFQRLRTKVLKELGLG